MSTESTEPRRPPRESPESESLEEEEPNGSVRRTPHKFGVRVRSPESDESLLLLLLLPLPRPLMSVSRRNPEHSSEESLLALNESRRREDPQLTLQTPHADGQQASPLEASTPGMPLLQTDPPGCYRTGKRCETTFKSQGRENPPIYKSCASVLAELRRAPVEISSFRSKI